MFSKMSGKCQGILKLPFCIRNRNDFVSFLKAAYSVNMNIFRNFLFSFYNHL